MLFDYIKKQIFFSPTEKDIETIDASKKKWGFKINKTKTCHTTFTRAGARSNYERKYELNIKIEQEEVPLEQNPTF
ncbi:hypothetical protein BpHYR1_002702 [Brachionus plicatilis]|uniref:RNA-directed DNA polymerase from mobile element jockey-like n=1 Tax=Brachionus plicatilis TaxID=10195 RepID=A0A3M7QI79_BRAPC|nr:hypothetical protein BpHYR1_002702 [Brachionus plicatilis]